MSDLPPDHPDRIPNETTTHYGLYVVQLQCRHWAIALGYDSTRLVLGHFETMAEAETHANVMVPPFLACIESSARAHGDTVSDLTSAAQALFDIANSGEIPPV